MPCTFDTGIPTLDEFCPSDHHGHSHNSNFSNISPSYLTSSSCPPIPLLPFESSLPPVLKAAIKLTVRWLQSADVTFERWLDTADSRTPLASTVQRPSPNPASLLPVEPLSPPPSINPSDSARATWSLGFSIDGFSPWVRTTGLSAASFPGGTSACHAIARSCFA